MSNRNQRVVIIGDQGAVHNDEPLRASEAEEGGDEAGGANINVNPSMSDQLLALQSQIVSIQRSLEDIKSLYEQQRIRSNRQFQVLNASVRKIVKQSERRIVPVVQAEQEAVPANNEPNQPINQTATLMQVPRTLNVLWEEWHRGVDGRKPVRLFTARERRQCKHTFHRRKLVWDLIAGLIRGGLTADAACDIIYDVYGRQSSVTTIINRLKADKKNNTLHVNLRV
jgi:hypothetical protein